MSTATTPKERGILFSPPMARAIREGRKWQTRRVCKPQPAMHDFGNGAEPTFINPAKGYSAIGVRAVNNGTSFFCPYGVPGDRLWVREPFYIDHVNWSERGPLPKVRPDEIDDDMLYYRADGECCQQIPECQCAGVGEVKWRPGMFMPRWASRITLEVTRVRVERVQSIACADVRAEGFSCPEHDFPGGFCTSRCLTLLNEFVLTWQAINGEASWHANPWVWVVDFKRVEERA